MAILEKRFKELLKELKLKFSRGIFFSDIISMLKHIEIIFEENIPTAQIERTSLNSIRIKISPNFFSTYVKTPQDLLFILSHETLHHILGHIHPEGQRLKRKYGQIIANVAMDIVINQMIYKELNEEKLEIIKFYKKLICPNALLIPPYIMRPENFEGKECKKWYDVITSYFHSPENSLIEIIHHTQSLAEHIKNVHTQRFEFEEVVISEEYKRKDSKEFPRYIKELLKKSFGLSEELKDEEIKKKRIQLKTELLSAIREMGEDEEGGIEEMSRGGGVLPFYARKDFLFISIETPTLLYHGNPSPEESKGIRLYVDVSGSVVDYLPHIFYALESIKNWIIFPVYGFSTRVFPISRRDLLRGKYTTTGGTDFNCIAKHIIKTRFRRAIIITDGESKMHKKYREYLKKYFQILTILVQDKKFSTEKVKAFSWKVIHFH